MFILRYALLSLVLIALFFVRLWRATARAIGRRPWVFGSATGVLTVVRSCTRFYLWLAQLANRPLVVYIRVHHPAFYQRFWRQLERR
jgi:hypothetical protein